MQERGWGGIAILPNLYPGICKIYQLPENKII